jgi:stress response protein YsnF
MPAPDDVHRRALEEIMASTVIGVFENAGIVGKLTDELVKAGLARGDIEVLEGGEDTITSVIIDHGFSEDDAREFAEAAGEGKTLVAARAPQAKLDRAVSIIERFEAAGEESKEEERSARQQRVTVPEVEEEFEVGKRKVVKGGVRVTSSVSEQPVEETVSLREERVKAERRAVDRDLRPEEAETAFEERTIEMTETSEEAEIEKQARVVGEVSLTKTAKEREQTVRDKVRHTEVEVEEISAGSRKRSK